MNEKVVIKNRKVTLTPEQRRNNVPIYLEQAPGIIIHPSFCCPLIIKPGEPITFYLLGTKVLMLDYFSERLEGDKVPSLKQIPKEGSAWISGRISRLLHMRSWDKVQNQTKKYKKVTGQDRPWFANFKTSLQNIKCFFQAKIGEDLIHDDTLRHKVLLKDANENLIGKIRTSAAELYSENGFRYLFRVEIHNHNLQNGLYDLCWITLDEDAYFDNKINPDNDITPFVDLQDVLIRKAIKQYGAPQNSYYTPDSKNQIQSYHPIYITDKQKLKIGHLTDIHISSRQSVFPKSKAQVIMGHSKTIGEMTHASFDSAKNLIQQMQQQNVDVLVITGDLLDFNYNLDPQKVNIEKTGDLWTELDLDNIKKTERIKETHAFGIDYTSVYNLIKEYYDVHKKPVYLVTGNHDSYKMPYGISPRVGPKRTNEGIPADHNLTIAEAILMFGPGYADILVPAHSLWANFKAKYSNWFHYVFTPLTDFIINTSEQTLIGIGWGNDETVIGARHPEHLPEADDVFTEQQMLLLESALKQNKPCVLFMHPTVINYELKYPLDANDAAIIISNENSCYSIGTFLCNRTEFFQEYLCTEKNNYILSGHSHRSGFYEPKAHNIEMSPHSYPGFPVFVEKLITRGYPLDNINIDEIGKKTRVIVTGSGGPIPIQNLNNEMQPHGLDVPTATIIDFTAKETIKVLQAKNATAKPRFAVVMDYYDLMGPGVFRSNDGKGFVSANEKTHIFTAKLDKGLPKVVFIKDIVFYVFDDTAKVSETVNPHLQFNIVEKKLILKFNLAHVEDYFKRIRSVIFISITFNKHDLSNQLGFVQYNFDSHWVIRVQINKRFGGGYRIERHAKYGEIPDFKWYRKHFFEFKANGQKTTTKNPI